MIPDNECVHTDGCWQTHSEGSTDEVASQETVMVGLHFESLSESRVCGQKLVIFPTNLYLPQCQTLDRW